MMCRPVLARKKDIETYPSNDTQAGSYYFDTWAGPDGADPVRWMIKASTKETEPMDLVAISTTNPNSLPSQVMQLKKQSADK